MRLPFVSSGRCSSTSSGSGARPPSAAGAASPDDRHLPRRGSFRAAPPRGSRARKATLRCSGSRRALLARPCPLAVARGVDVASLRRRHAARRPDPVAAACRRWAGGVDLIPAVLIAPRRPGADPRRWPRGLPRGPGNAAPPPSRAPRRARSSRCPPDRIGTGCWWRPWSEWWSTASRHGRPSSRRPRRPSANAKAFRDSSSHAGTGADPRPRDRRRHRASAMTSYDLRRARRPQALLLHVRSTRAQTPAGHQRRPQRRADSGYRGSLAAERRPACGADTSTPWTDSALCHSAGLRKPSPRRLAPLEKKRWNSERARKTAMRSPPRGDAKRCGRAAPSAPGECGFGSTSSSSAGRPRTARALAAMPG